MSESPELGPLEMQTLGLIGPAESLPVQTVQERLAAAGSELAYTTVMTVLARLTDKKLLAREKDGRRFLYRRAEMAPNRARDVVARIQRTLFKNSPAEPILALLDDDSLSESDLKALRRHIDQKLKAKR